ncbi:PfkB family carbohydrate kinase [Lacticaseibacillus suilingensis]|uniref:PfkB family carbohydrate kinase n=1 Tax=Lacticaseibacillus suilingensis TaxID=2799577 RepID=A0ABW4BFY4_9LACO|nr:PfkB family carbohydrate kinase [Lacticaseibacillus suilingensis]
MAKTTLAMADNCIDVYLDSGRFYLTGNSVDFAMNYRGLGGAVTEMTVLGNDLYAEALEVRLAKEGIPLRVMARVDKPTAVAKMKMEGTEKIYLGFTGNAMDDMAIGDSDKQFINNFDIVYAERWSKAHTFISEVKQPGQIWVYDFSRRLDQEINAKLLPNLDYAFFSYEKDDEWIRKFLKSSYQAGAKTVIAMLGGEGSLAYDGHHFYKESAGEAVVVNTVGAGDSYIAGFTYGVSLGWSVPDCMTVGKERATKVIQQFNPYL